MFGLRQTQNDFLYNTEEVDSLDLALWCAMLIRTFLNLVRLQINPKGWRIGGN